MFIVTVAGTEKTTNPLLAHQETRAGPTPSVFPSSPFPFPPLHSRLLAPQASTPHFPHTELVKKWPGMIAHTYNPSQEAEVERLPCMSLRSAWTLYQK